MNNIKLQFKGVSEHADEHICISLLKRELSIKHDTAKYIVQAAKLQQVTTIETEVNLDRTQLVTNLNFFGLKTSIV